MTTRDCGRGAILSLMPEERRREKKRGMEEMGCLALQILPSSLRQLQFVTMIARLWVVALSALLPLIPSTLSVSVQSVENRHWFAMHVVPNWQNFIAATIDICDCVILPI
jgi:hypothetical protein